jgi:hypothetical protein
LSLLRSIVSRQANEFDKRSMPFMAFALGFNSQPLAIHFGSSSLLNILLLGNIDEHVDYDSIFAHDSAPASAVIGLAGPLANGALYLASLALMRLPGQLQVLCWPTRKWMCAIMVAASG